MDEEGFGITDTGHAQDYYRVHCCLCGKSSSLCMVPHRVDGKLIGWVFACNDGCWEELKNKEMTFILDEPI